MPCVKKITDDYGQQSFVQNEDSIGYPEEECWEINGFPQESPCDIESDDMKCTCGKRKINEYRRPGDQVICQKYCRGGSVNDPAYPDSKWFNESMLYTNVNVPKKAFLLATGCLPGVPVHARLCEDDKCLGSSCIDLELPNYNFDPVAAQVDGQDPPFLEPVGTQKNTCINLLSNNRACRKLPLDMNNMAATNLGRLAPTLVKYLGNTGSVNVGCMPNMDLIFGQKGIIGTPGTTAEQEPNPTFKKETTKFLADIDQAKTDPIGAPAKVCPANQPKTAK